MILPVKVYTPFSRMETEGVMVKAEREEEGVAVLAEGEGGVEMKSGRRGRSGKRTFERVAVENSYRVVPMPVREKAESREDVAVEASSVSEEEEVVSEPVEEEEEVVSEPVEEEDDGRRVG